MRPTFHPRLINSPFEDPVLFVNFSFDRRALLFDLGHIYSLPPKELLKVTHVFVSHTHMDHFAGFDTLLRLFLRRKKSLRLFGPPGFLKNVEGKLAAYSWNLVSKDEDSFHIEATEVHPDSALTRVYRAKEGFISTQSPLRTVFEGLLLKEPAFSVHAIHLDHKIPCLAFLLAERFHVNIMKDRLKKVGIPAGPWLKEFKDMLYENHDPEEDFRVVWEEEGKQRQAAFRLGDLARQIAHISPGQKVAYVVDVVFSPDNARKITAFARHADQLFIEAAFLDAQADVARAKYHLTAEQAGTLARQAAVRSFTVFHFSPRYADVPHLLYEEAERAFRNAPNALYSLGE